MHFIYIEKNRLFYIKINAVKIELKLEINKIIIKNVNNF